MKLCTIEGCSNKHKARDYCRKHYQRWLRYGDPNHTVKEYYHTPEERFAARTEWQGDCLIWAGGKDSKGYGLITIEGARAIPVHKYSWEKEYGKVPDLMVVDHIDHCDPACCNTKHLRLATRSQNSMNRVGAISTNTSGVRNVTWHEPTQKWRVRVGGRYLGLFTNKEEAARVAEEARQELFGEFAGKGIKYES